MALPDTRGTSASKTLLPIRDSDTSWARITCLRRPGHATALGGGAGQARPGTQGPCGSDEGKGAGGHRTRPGPHTSVQNSRKLRTPSLLASYTLWMYFRRWMPHEDLGDEGAGEARGPCRCSARPPPPPPPPPLQRSDPPAHISGRHCAALKGLMQRNAVMAVHCAHADRALQCTLSK